MILELLILNVFGLILLYCIFWFYSFVFLVWDTLYVGFFFFVFFIDMEVVLI